MRSLGIITLVISAMAGVMSCGASCLLAPVALSQGASKQLAPQLYAAKLLTQQSVASSVSLAMIDQDPKDLIKAAITRPWPGVNYPALPALSSEILERVALEITRSEAVRRAYEKLDAKRPNVEWFDGVDENATIHGIIHESIAETLSSLTGIGITIRGQNPDGLKNGIRQWRRWLADQDIKPPDIRDIK